MASLGNRARWVASLKRAVLTGLRIRIDCYRKMVNFEQGTLLRVSGSLYYVSELLIESEHCPKDGTDRAERRKSNPSFGRNLSDCQPQASR